LDTAWSILEAANDLGGGGVDICRRVIDVVLCGANPMKSDIDVIFDLFH
jgi:hypothetical protein